MGNDIGLLGKYFTIIRARWAVDMDTFSRRWSAPAYPRFVGPLLALSWTLATVSKIKSRLGQKTTYFGLKYYAAKPEARVAGPLTRSTYLANSTSRRKLGAERALETPPPGC
jgi:hypothetical protein